MVLGQRDETQAYPYLEGFKTELGETEWPFHCRGSALGWQCSLDLFSIPSWRVREGLLERHCSGERRQWNGRWQGGHKGWRAGERGLLQDAEGFVAAMLQVSGAGGGCRGSPEAQWDGNHAPSIGFFP